MQEFFISCLTNIIRIINNNEDFKFTSLGEEV
jgi:hypothetical protein